MTKNQSDLPRTSSFFRSALCMFIASIALLVNALDELGISNNTIVIFCADNGTHGPVTSIWGDGGHTLASVATSERSKQICER